MPTQPRPETDYAWAAGFLDGDGCFSLSKNPRKGHPSGRTLNISAVQVDRTPLYRLQELFGGYITRLGVTKKGSEIWQWRTNDAQHIRQIVPKIAPYLVAKRREAEIVYEFSETVGTLGALPKGVERYTDELLAKRFALIRELDEIRAIDYSDSSERAA